MCVDHNFAATSLSIEMEEVPVEEENENKEEGEVKESFTVQRPRRAQLARETIVSGVGGIR